MASKIQELREKLNDAVLTHSINSSMVLELSRKLDTLIVEYYIENADVSVA